MVLAYSRTLNGQSVYPDLQDPAFTPPPAQRIANALRLAMEPGGNPASLDEIKKRLLARALASSLSVQQIVQNAESASQNIQNGSSPASVGTTSLVSKAVTTILGVSEEAGAISSSASGSTTTLSANIPQFVNFVAHPQHPCYLLSENCPFGSLLLRGLSASVSINSSASNTPSSTGLSSAALSALSGTNNPVFSGFTFQENFRGRKNTGITQQTFQKALDGIDTQKKTALLNTLTALDKDITGAPGYQNTLNSCIQSLQVTDATGDHLKDLANACVDSFVALAQQVNSINTAFTSYSEALVAYNNVRDAALATLFYRNSFTIEYDFANVLNQPSTSAYKFIYGNQSKSGAFQSTVNGSATLYNSLEGSAGSRVRSAQVAVQLDYKPATKPKLQAAWSAGYYFQYMVSNGLLTLPSTDFAPNTTVPLSGSASTLLNTTGPIHVGQGKVTLSLKGTNISVPLAFTGASRTDLIKATKVSGNFGISYDFSSLFAK